MQERDIAMMKTQKDVVNKIIQNKNILKNETSLLAGLNKYIPGRKGEINALLILYREGIMESLSETGNIEITKEGYVDILENQYAINRKMSEWAVNTWYYVMNPDIIDNSPGKQKCKFLREMRVKIAEENNIDFIPIECNHFGECMGTCYICDSEIAFLDKELEKRKNDGKQIVLEGVSGEEVDRISEILKEKEFNKKDIFLGGITSAIDVSDDDILFS